MTATKAEPVIDPTDGGFLTLQEVADLFPAGRQGRPVHRKTVARWITDGLTHRDGRVVKLEGVQLGQRRLCTRRAVREFVHRLRVAAAGPPAGAANGL